MENVDLITIGAGLVLGMFYYSRTGWTCGGIIVPGILALYISDPVAVVFSLVMGIAVSFLLVIPLRFFGLYGRQRIASAMLIALLLKLILVTFNWQGTIWLGWVVPGLVGADIQRQGIIETLSGAVSVSIASVMAVQFLFMLPGVLL